MQKCTDRANKPSFLRGKGFSRSMRHINAMLGLSLCLRCSFFSEEPTDPLTLIKYNKNDCSCLCLSFQCWNDVLWCFVCTTVKYGKEDIIDALSDVSTSKVSHTFPNPLYQQQGSCQEYKSSTQEISNFQLPAHFSKRGNRIGGAVQSIIETLAFPKPVFLNSRSSVSPIQASIQKCIDSPCSHRMWSALQACSARCW